MRTDRPGEVVRELVALFRPLNVGVGFASEIRDARDIDGRKGAARNFRVVEVGQATAGILEAKLVDLVVAGRPGVLHGPGHVAVRLLRCARISVLPERLILAAHLDTGDRARTYVRA